MSKGEILSYLAADDFLLPGAVTKSVGKLIATPEIVSTYCDFDRVDPESRVLWRGRTPQFSYSGLSAGICSPPGARALFPRGPVHAAGLLDEPLKTAPDYL